MKKKTMKPLTIISTAGVCPHCGSNNLKYDDHEFNGGSVIFNYECKKCTFVGYEEYTCDFVGHSDTNGHQFWSVGEETKDD
jgi:RNA polymerase subunit RPABC4/transcription elongation factor Spt4